MMLVYAAIGFTLGIALYEFLSLKTILLIACTAVCGGIIVSLIKRDISFVFMILAAAMLYFGNVYANYSDDIQKRELYKFTNSHCTIKARICELPVCKNGLYKYVAEACEVEYDGEAYKTDERIMITSYNKYDFNDTVSFTVKLKEFSGELNEYGFNSAKYYKSQNIYFKGHSVSDKPSAIPIKNYSLHTVFNLIKYKLCGIIDRYFANDKNAVLKAVLLGETSGFSDAYNEALISTGLRRYFYQAHIHIMLIMLLINMLASFVPKRIRDYMLCLLLIIYASASNGSPVCIKAVIFMIGTILSKRIYGFLHKPSLIATVTLVMLVSRPMLVFNGAFVMAIGSSILMFMFGEWAINHMTFIKNLKLRYYLCASIVCTLGMISIVSIYYGGVGLYSIVFGFACIGLTVLIIAFAPLMLLMLVLFGSAPVISNVVSFPVYMYLKLPYFIEKLPFSHINLPVASVWAMLVNIFLVISLYRHIKNRSKLLWLIMAFLSAGIGIGLEIPRLNRAEITFVNVGQGDGAVISMPYRMNVIIDGGGGNEYTDYNAGETVFLPYLKTHGKTKIEAAFISHFHSDHVQGVISAVEKLNVLRVFAPVCEDDNKYKQELERVSKEKGTQIIYLDKDTEIKFKNGLEFEIITSDSYIRQSKDENDECLLINVKYGEFNALFTGDITEMGQKRMLATKNIPECEVLKVPHHGSRNSACKEFNERVNSEIAIISLGEDNTYGFPHKETIDLLGETEILRTDECADITVSAELSGEYKLKMHRRAVNKE